MRRLRHNAASCIGPARISRRRGVADATTGAVPGAIEARASASRPRLPSRVARHPGVVGSTRTGRAGYPQEAVCGLPSASTRLDRSHRIVRSFRRERKKSPAGRAGLFV